MATKDAASTSGMAVAVDPEPVTARAKKQPTDLVRVKCLDEGVGLSGDVRIVREGEPTDRLMKKGEVFQIERKHAAQLGDRFEVLES